LINPGSNVGTTKSNNNRRKRKISYTKIAALIFSAAIFALLLEEQNKAISPKIIRGNLQQKEQIISLQNWSAKLLRCDPLDLSICAQVGQIDNLDFPAKDRITSVVKNIKNKPTKVELTHILTENEISWLEYRPTTVLLLPRMVHRYSYLTNYPARQLQVGMGANLSFTIRGDIVRQEKQIKMEIEFSDFEWFGPADLPIVLSEPNTVAKYESIPGLAVSSTHLSKQLDIALPLVLSGMALILDHSRSFQALSLLAVSRAARSYLSFISELYGEWIPNHYLDFLFILVNSLTISFLIFFVGEVSEFPVSRKNLIWIGLAGFTCFSIARLNIPSFRFQIDLWADAIACIIGFPIAMAGAFRQMTKSKKRQLIKGERTTAKKSEVTLVLSRTALVIFGLSTTAWANISDMINLSDSNFKDTLQLGHTTLIPIFIIVALLEIGSITRKMRGFARTMVEKAMLEHDIDVGKEVQNLLLPPMQGKGDFWEWRAFYYPSTTLAGDWFDIRKIETADGNDYIVCCVVDVTGHGIGAALISTAISSHWSIWCRNQIGKNGPKNDAEREALAISAPKSIHDGLTALRQNTGCTAAFIVLDEKLGRGSYCTAGHPGILQVTEDQKVSYLATAGTRPGFSESKIGWKSKSVDIQKNDQIFIYSDGIIPHNLTFSGWLKKICRPRTPSTQPISLTVLKGIKENKNAFRKNRIKEDDMSLLILKRSA